MIIVKCFKCYKTKHFQSLKTRYIQTAFPWGLGGGMLPSAAVPFGKFYNTFVNYLLYLVVISLLL